MEKEAIQENNLMAPHFIPSFKYHLNILLDKAKEKSWDFSIKTVGGMISGKMEYGETEKCPIVKISDLEQIIKELLGEKWAKR